MNRKLCPSASKACNSRLQNEGRNINPYSLYIHFLYFENTVLNIQVQFSVFHMTIIFATFTVIQTNHKSFMTNTPTITDFQSVLSQTAVKSEGGRLVLPTININMHKHTLASAVVLYGWLASTGKGEVFLVCTMKAYRKIRGVARTILNLSTRWS
jgi:hypothetical protein